MTKLNRSDYANSLRELADTILYETAIDVCKLIIKDGHSPSSNCHWMNSCIYQEFWRRNKAAAYYAAYNAVQEEFKGKKGIINNPIDNQSVVDDKKLVSSL